MEALQQALQQLQQLHHQARGDDPTTAAVQDALHRLLADRLVGNRSVAAGRVWSMVTAATRAFPIQLGPTTDKAVAVVHAAAAASTAASPPQEDEEERQLVRAWILQACADGTLALLVEALPTQPQILTAYARDAPLRDARCCGQLVALLRTLQPLMPPSPYERHLAAQAAAAPAATAGSAAPPIHVQTERDLLPATASPCASTASSASGGSSSAAGGKGSSSSSVPSACGSLGVGPEQQAADQQQQHQQPAGLYGRLKGSFAKRPAAGAAAAGQQEQAAPEQRLLTVRLVVAPPAAAALNSPPVQLHIKVLPQQAGAPGGAGQQASSSASLLMGDSVKGLLQGLQQTAAAGLQQASAASGQDLSGAVAAAGGAVAGAVKSLVAARAGGAKKRPAAAGTVSSSSSTRQPGPSSSSSHQLVRVQLIVQPQGQQAGQPAQAEAAQHIRLVLTAVDQAAGVAAAAAPGSREGGWGKPAQLLDRLRMSRGSAGTREAAPHPQQQQPEQAGGGEPDALDDDMWSLMSRLRNTGSMSARAPAVGTSSDDAAAAAAAQQQQQQQESGQVLAAELVECCRHVAAAAAATKGALGEEDAELLRLVALVKAMLNHGLLHANSSSNAVVHSGGSAAGPTTQAGAQRSKGGGSGSSRPTTPEGGADSPAAAASSSTSAASLASGLRQGVTATARGVLGSLLQLPGRQQSAFGVLQALQHGSKAQPRLMLGADGIARLTKGSGGATPPPDALLDLWVRASLNEQLLGCRVSTLLANPAALAPSYYSPGALLLQHEPMSRIMAGLAEVSDHRVALPVDVAAASAAAAAAAGTAPAAGAGPAVAAATAAAGVAAAAASAAAAAGASGVVAAAFMGNPRRLLMGGLQRMASSSTSSAAAPPPPPAAAASSSGPAVATFAWGSSTQEPAPVPSSASPGLAASAPGDADPAGSGAGGGGFFKRRLGGLQLRVPVGACKPPASQLAKQASVGPGLSPVSTADEAAFAQWWSPSSSAQDLALSAEAAAGGDGSHHSHRSGGSDGRPALPQRRPSSDGSTGATSAAALKIEADLMAALGSSSRSSRSASKSGGGESGTALRRAASAGGIGGGSDAAVSEDPDRLQP